MGLFDEGGFSEWWNRPERPATMDRLWEAIPAIAGGAVALGGERMGLSPQVRALFGILGPYLSRGGQLRREGRERTEEEVARYQPSEESRAAFTHDLPGLTPYQHYPPELLADYAEDIRNPERAYDLAERWDIREGQREETLGTADEIRGTSGESFERAQERTDTPVVSQAEIDMLAAKMRNEINRSMGDIAERRSDEAAALGRSTGAIEAGRQELEGQSIYQQTQAKMDAALQAADINRAAKQAFAGQEISAADLYMGRLIPQLNLATGLSMPDVWPSDIMAEDEWRRRQDFEQVEAARTQETLYHDQMTNMFGGFAEGGLNAARAEDLADQQSGWLGAGGAGLTGAGMFTSIAGAAIPGLQLAGLGMMGAGTTMSAVDAAQGGGGGGGGGGYGTNMFPLLFAQSQMGGQGLMGQQPGLPSPLSYGGHYPYGVNEPGMGAANMPFGDPYGPVSNTRMLPYGVQSQ